MSEREFDNWMNLAPQEQMQVLGTLMEAAGFWADSPGCSCRTRKCGLCLACGVRTALTLLQSRPGKAVAR